MHLRLALAPLDRYSHEGRFSLMIQPEPSQEIDQFTPPMRELADGMAQYIQSFVEEVVACEGNPAAIDWQYLAEDFVESCVVDIMAVGGGPLDLALARKCWCATCEALVLAYEHPNDRIAQMAGRRFVTCRDCGDKRCPRASHHVYDCVNV